MSTNFYEEIINNYKKLYETKEDYDVKIYAGEKPNIKEFHVHSFILKTQSEFFKKAFTTKDGFIFSFTDRNNLQTAKVSCQSNPRTYWSIVYHVILIILCII